MKIHFIAGFPRAGSTMMAAILNQNPKFKAYGPSPLCNMLLSVQHMMDSSHLGIDITDSSRISAMKGLIEGFYEHTDKIPVDTCTYWTSKLPLINHLYPHARVICCVRNLSWVIDSLERNVNNNWMQISGLASGNNSSTLYSRISSYFAPDGVIGSSADSFREGYYGDFSNKLIIVDYDKIVHNPEYVMQRLYEYLGEENFQHDFNNLQFNLDAHDVKYAIRGLHTVRKKLEAFDRKTILPPDVFDKYKDTEFWKVDRNTDAILI